MIKFTPTFLVLLLSFTLFGQSQDPIPNGSFETWTDGLPAPWIAPYNLSNFSNVFQSDDSQDGTASAELKVLYYDLLQVYFPAELTIVDFPASNRPASLKGYFKGIAAGPDSLYVTVVFSRNSELIAFGEFATTEVVSNWTEFTAPISWLSPADPDSATIVIVSGSTASSTDGTDYWVDNLYFSGSASGTVDRPVEIKCSLSPVPAHDFLNVSFDLNNREQIKFDIITQMGWTIAVPHAEYFNAGPNKFRISTADLEPGYYILRGKSSTLVSNMGFVVGN